MSLQRVTLSLPFVTLSLPFVTLSLSKGAHRFDPAAPSC
jgi:hypothetical protein